MSDLSDDLEVRIPQFFFRADADTDTPATTIYLALFTSATNDAGGGTEVSDSNAYARKSFTFDAWSGTSGLQDNGSAITFTTPSGGDWGTVTHVAIVDSATHAGGNFLAHGALDSSVVMTDGDTFEVGAGDCNMTFA